MVWSMDHYARTHRPAPVTTTRLTVEIGSSRGVTDIWITARQALLEHLAGVRGGHGTARPELRASVLTPEGGRRILAIVCHLPDSPEAARHLVAGLRSAIAAALRP